MSAQVELCCRQNVILCSQVKVWKKSPTKNGHELKRFYLRMGPFGKNRCSDLVDHRHHHHWPVVRIGVVKQTNPSSLSSTKLHGNFFGTSMADRPWGIAWFSSGFPYWIIGIYWNPHILDSIIPILWLYSPIIIIPYDDWIIGIPYDSFWIFRMSRHPTEAADPPGGVQSIQQPGV